MLLYDGVMSIRFLRPAWLLFFTIIPLAAQQPLARSSAPSPSAIAGSLSGGDYRNFYFGFYYMVPYGWVDRTHEMGQDANQSAQAQLLLAVFERPPEATGTTINSAVVITAETVSSYHGLKSAADYFGPISQITSAKGFQVVNEPYEFAVGTKKLVRADYSKPRGQLTMHQSSLVMLDHGYVVTFTLIGGSDDEINSLIQNLSFRRASRPR
jgi:hypothetical protein